MTDHVWLPMASSDPDLKHLTMWRCQVCRRSVLRSSLNKAMPKRAGCGESLRPRWRFGTGSLNPKEQS